VSPFVRKVKTASGATAVQIVEKRSGVRRIVEHVGSAHDELGLALLMQGDLRFERGRRRIALAAVRITRHLAFEHARQIVRAGSP
jgi:hypothetical protein